MSVKKRDNLSISPWIQRFSHLIAPGSSVLDLAAGGGRHVRWFLNQGCKVTALDRDIGPLKRLRSTLNIRNNQLEILGADLEDGSPWPLRERRFDGIVVVNYLWRPLFPSILESLDVGGVLLYETFALGQEAFGRPKCSDFLLQPGELVSLVGERLTIVAFEHGLVEGGNGPAVKQRIAATLSVKPLPLDAL